MITSSPEETEILLRQLGCTCSSVVSILKETPEDVYDISLEPTGKVVKAFEANGIIVHNSSDQEYIGNMMKTLGLKGNPSTLFGVRDDTTGTYLVPPTIRYYSHDVGEDFFRYLAKIKRALPNVEKHGNDWFYVYEHTKPNKSMLAGFYDPKYLTKTNLLRVPAPDGFMQAIYICDSYPAMLPEGLDDDDRNDAMAEQARMFSTGIKKIRGGMRKKRMTVIGVNQTRQRPAVMFGCLHGSTKVPFVDGSVHTMQEIVENKIKGQVWSFNEETRSIEPRDIIDYHYNGEVQEKSQWIKLVTRCPETDNGQAFVICTPNHEILTDNGWKRADEVKLTDRLVSKANLNESLSVYVDMIRIEEGSDRAFRKRGKYDISVEHNHNYMVGNSSNGIIVHNSPEYEPCGEALRFYSDVRLKTTSRSSTPFGGFKLDKGIMEEPSVTVKGGKDIYRFIAIKSVKNKLGGIPNREVWARLWVSDGDGNANGFDPVFDTYYYLHSLGLVKGTMANLKFHPSTPLADAKQIKWQDFKLLVLGSKKEITELCTKLGLAKAGSIRNWVKNHCSSGAGPKLYKDRIVKTAKEDIDEETGEIT